MGKAKHPLTREEFEAIYNKVPRLCVDLIVVTPKGVTLSRRIDPPAVGQWHLPGGTVHKGERLLQTVERIAQEELHISAQDFIETPEMVGVIEYDFSQEEDYEGFPVGIAYIVKVRTMPTLGRSASDLAFFRTLPDEMIFDQRQFMENNEKVSTILEAV